jgi:hypothetical protein
LGRLIFISILLQMWALKNWKGIMDYPTLGNTGLLISKLCFGTMIFGKVLRHVSLGCELGKA